MEIVPRTTEEKKPSKKKKTNTKDKANREETFESASPDCLLYGFEESMYHTNKNGSIQLGYLGPFGILHRETKRYLETEIPYKLEGGRTKSLTISLYEDAKKFRGWSSKRWACLRSRGPSRIRCIELGESLLLQIGLEMVCQPGLMKSLDRSDEERSYNCLTLRFAL